MKGIYVARFLSRSAIEKGSDINYRRPMQQNDRRSRVFPSIAFK